MKHRIKVVFFVVVAILSIQSCSKIKDSVGSNLIPESQQMKLSFDTSIVFNAYNEPYGVFKSSIFHFGHIGKLTKSGFSSVESGVAFNVTSPAVENEEDFPFISGTVPDSVILTIAVDKVYGNKEAVVDFDLFELTKTLDHNIKYYSNTDIAPFATSLPIVSFSHTGEGVINIKLPLEIGYKLLDAPREMYIGDYGDTLDLFDFYEYFKGFAIKYKSHTDSGAMFKLNFEASSFKLYYTNAKGSNNVSFYIQDPEKTQGMYTAFSFLKRDSSLSSVYPTLSSGSPASEVAIEGFGGIQTHLKIDTITLNNFVTKVKAENPDGTIAIIKASLVFNTSSSTQDFLDFSPKRLGLYEKNVDTIITIADYTPSGDVEGVGVEFDGYLVRSSSTYTLNIATYLQALIKGTKLPKDPIILSSDITDLYNTQAQKAPLLFEPYMTKLSIGEIKLMVTYSIIK